LAGNSNYDPFAEAEQAAAAAPEADPFAEAEAAVGEPAGAPADPFAEAEAKAGPAQAAEGPKGPTGAITEAELQVVAKEFGVSADELAASAPFLGLSVQGRDNSSFWKGAGFLGEGLAFGLPQKVFIERQEKPEERAALQTLRDIGEERKSGARTAAEMASGLVGGIGAAKTLASVGARFGGKVATATKAIDKASPVLSGAAYGASHAREGEELKGGLTGAGFGLVGMGAFKLLGKGFRALKGLGDDGAKLIAKATDGLDLDRRSAEAAKDAIPAAQRLVATGLNSDPKELAPEAAQQLRGFAKYLGVESDTLEAAQKAIKAKIAQEGEEQVQKELANQVQTQKAFELMGTDIDNLYRREGWGGDTSFFQRVRDVFRDGLMTMRRIDDKLGTSLETGVAQALGRANNRYTVTLGAITKDVSTVKKAMKAANLQSEDLYRALDTGDVSKLQPDQMKAFETAKQAWENMRQLANSLGLPVQKLAGGTYVKHAIVQPDEYVARMIQRADGLKGKLGDIINQGLDDKGFEKLKELDEDLIKGVSLFSDTNISDGASFTAALRESLGGRNLTETFQTKAAAAQLREGSIPEFLREKDIPALMGRWAQNTFKHTFYREGIADLRKARDMAVAANDKDAATYLTNLLADVSGVRQNTLHGATKKAITNYQISMRKAAEAASTPASKSFHNFLAEAPNFIPNLFQQVYPNFMGLKPQAIIMNMTQPWMTTVPELGFGYGSGKVLKAYARVADIAASGRDIVLSPETAKLLGREAGEAFRTRNPALLMRNEGQLPMQWSTELRDALRQGIAKSAPVRLASDALNKVTDISMKAFELSEVMNRAIAREVAADVTGDLLGKGSAKANAAAQNFLQQSGSAFRRQAEQLIRSGDAVALEKLTREYLTSRTIFNYNRATMSEFGRFVGPALAVFTKWPFMIAGDVMEQYRRRGALGGSSELARKYLAPLMAVWAVDRLVLPDADESPTRRFILGGGGLTSAAPIGTVMSIVSGKVMQPPVVATVGKLTAGVMAGDPLGGAWRAFNGALESFTPGAVLLRTYTDVRDWRAEEKSEGTFLNKLAPDLEVDERVNELKESATEALDDAAYGR
jgi:hypothetical protein